VVALDVPVFLLTGRTRANTLDIARRAGLRHLVAGLQRIADLRPGR
jgi:hypothetical protein